VSPEGITQGADGNFYGTTSLGGTHNSGTVFRISASGVYTSLYSFIGYPSDGQVPVAGLVQGTNGYFYGTTEFGGASDFAGTVFRISPSGAYTSLYSFAGYPDGFYPNGLVQGSDGNLYGTTIDGGTSTNCPEGCGTAFRVTPNGSEKILYSFQGFPNDGKAPFAGLVQGSDGNFYGTTGYGFNGTNFSITVVGSFVLTNGYGSIFRISPSGVYTSLYSFGTNAASGRIPQNTLVQGSDGNFYGVTGQGGTNGYGALFRISPSGTFTTLWQFGGIPNDGEGPEGQLVQGSDGNIYGTTYQGGTNGLIDGGYGTVFRISPSGVYTTVYSFAGPPNDGRIGWGITQGTDGNFYGLTSYGGSSGSGTVFRLAVPLNPAPWPINQITQLNVSGTNIVYAIPSIAGETYQLQYRSAMTSGNWSNVPGVSVTNSIGALMTLTNFGGASQPQGQGFYRFAITP
jgi:uncharacterized repeat protein (TIGR03803 family)